jgi:hypothetical protein
MLPFTTKVAAQRNGANLPQQKPNSGPSSSSDPEDNAALEDWAATRIQNVFRRYKVPPILCCNTFILTI